MDVLKSFVNNCPNLEATKMSFNWRMMGYYSELKLNELSSHKKIKSAIIKQNLCSPFYYIANYMGIIFDPCYSHGPQIHSITKSCWFHLIIATSFHLIQAKLGLCIGHFHFYLSPKKKNLVIPIRGLQSPNEWFLIEHRKKG